MHGKTVKPCSCLSFGPLPSALVLLNRFSQICNSKCGATNVFQKANCSVMVVCMEVEFHINRQSVCVRRISEMCSFRSDKQDRGFRFSVGRVCALPVSAGVLPPSSSGMWVWVVVCLDMWASEELCDLSSMHRRKRKVMNELTNKCLTYCSQFVFTTCEHNFWSKCAQHKFNLRSRQYIIYFKGIAGVWLFPDYWSIKQTCASPLIRCVTFW